MHFLPDVSLTCDVCHGKRYNRATLEILYKGYSVHQVLDMTVEDALELFKAVPTLSRKLETLMDVGLSYIKLGQSATTLPGGEAQRVKLSKELSRRSTGRTPSDANGSARARKLVPMAIASASRRSPFVSSIAATRPSSPVTTRATPCPT